MMRLGKNQRGFLKTIGVGRFQVVADSTSKSLIKHGLVKVWGEDSFVGITSKGLLYLADEADAGRLSLAPDPKYLKKEDVAS